MSSLGRLETPLDAKVCVCPDNKLGQLHKNSFKCPVVPRQYFEDRAVYKNHENQDIRNSTKRHEAKMYSASMPCVRLYCRLQCLVKCYCCDARSQTSARGSGHTTTMYQVCVRTNSCQNCTSSPQGVLTTDGWCCISGCARARLQWCYTISVNDPEKWGGWRAAVQTQKFFAIAPKIETNFQRYKPPKDSLEGGTDGLQRP